MQKFPNHFHEYYIIGFVVAIMGIFLINFNGSVILKRNPIGDLLAVLAALCFATWNTAVGILGAVKTSIYIYMVPAITVITSILVLHEKITWVEACGTVLTVGPKFTKKEQ